MNTEQLPIDVSEMQKAIYGVALSLDAFLVNGIPYGVLQRPVFPGFLEKTAGNLMRSLASLEEHVAHCPATNQSEVVEGLAALRASCQQLIQLTAGLSSFRTLSLQQLRSAVSQIPLLRGECVQRLQELEASFRTPKPFYQSRPSDSTAAVNAFCANLEQMFAEEWAVSNAATEQQGAQEVQQQ
jgi:hypothetical protein